MSMTSTLFKDQFPAIAENCGPKGLEDLVLALQIRNVQAGEAVITEGEDCDSLFLVKEGELVSKIASGGEDIRVGSLKNGDYFGEVNILDPGPSTSTVIASKDSTLLVLTHDAFKKLDMAHPVMTGNILRMLSLILIERCRIADEILFGDRSGAEDPDTDSSEHSNMIKWGRDILQKLHGHEEIAE